MEPTDLVMGMESQDSGRARLLTVVSQLPGWRAPIKLRMAMKQRKHTQHHWCLPPEPAVVAPWPRRGMLDDHQANVARSPPLASLRSPSHLKTYSSAQHTFTPVVVFLCRVTSQI
jgi:hypothetical protein